MSGMKFERLAACALLALLPAISGVEAQAAIGACGEAATLIHDIQGSGTASPLDGNIVVIEGVVTGDFQESSSLNGFFVQEEDSEADGDPATSEGIFVFEGGSAVEVVAGDLVRVEGRVDEFFQLTELTDVLDVLICGAGSVTESPLALPVAALAEFEEVEGMLVEFSNQTHFVTENFTLGRFGELSLSSGGRLYQPTQIALPGAPAEAVGVANALNQIILDDARNGQNLDPVPYLDASGTRRIGDTVEDLQAVMSFGFNSYRLQPVGGPEAIEFGTSSPRPLPPSVDGAFKIVGFNVANYFTTLDAGAPVCGPSGGLDCRGADTASEFERQRAKLIAALVALDADVIGLVELENNPSASVADLVAGLNDATGAGLYDFVDTGTIGTDAIKVGFIYKTATVQEVGSFAILDSSVDPRFLDTKNRPSLAQTFEETATGEVLTIVVNHLKSKGSACDDVGDLDLGDGQGNCNLTRLDAANALVNWLGTDPTGSGDPDFLIIGDLNAYSQEDPIQVFLDGGYTDLLLRDVGGGTSYEFSTFSFLGAGGALDHALASGTLGPKITGSAIWRINSEEPVFLNYDEDFKSQDLIASLETDAFRSSDHDPVIVGLSLFEDMDGDGLADADDPCPDSVTTADVVIDGCNSGAANTLVAGCSVVDDILEIAGGARNHGAFASQVARYLNSLLEDGDLTDEEEGAVQSCVAEAALP